MRTLTNVIVGQLQIIQTTGSKSCDFSYLEFRKDL